MEYLPQRQFQESGPSKDKFVTFDYSPKMHGPGAPRDPNIPVKPAFGSEDNFTLSGVRESDPCTQANIAATNERAQTVLRRHGNGHSHRLG